jgi:isopenicillin N synthase-like dioxygenase
LSSLSKNVAFSCASIKVPVVDVKPFLMEAPSQAECKQVAEALHKYGCLIIKDPRVNQAENDRFLDLMEKYFNKRAQEYYQKQNAPDIHPEWSYQVGATPEFKEKAKDHSGHFGEYTAENKPITPNPVPYDAKWRYFWDISTDDSIKKRYPNVVPEDFPEFEEVMSSWGRHMIDGCYTVAQMAAIGLGLDRNIFTQMMNGGEHKLAPTGSDLSRYQPPTTFAGYHYDFNFLTIHGKSRYPGLFAWLRTGEKFSVSVPEGHLLLQAGKQFEYVTGGYINCGFHEVIYTDKVAELKEKAIKEGRIPWRISSTLFSHLRLDVVMQPIDKFATKEAKEKYPPITVADHTAQELKDIMLGQ